jgi:hypothetical protein
LLCSKILRFRDDLAMRIVTSSRSQMQNNQCSLANDDSTEEVEQQAICSIKAITGNQRNHIVSSNTNSKAHGFLWSSDPRRFVEMIKDDPITKSESVDQRSKKSVKPLISLRSDVLNGRFLAFSSSFLIFAYPFMGYAFIY